MIAITNAVVHKGAVVIEFFYTLFTVIAVKGPPWFYDPAIETEVFKVNTSFIRDS